jgi:hypothetical protein
MFIRKICLALIFPLLVACFAGSDTTPTPSASMTPTPGLAGLPTPFSTPTPLPSNPYEFQTEEQKAVLNDRGMIRGYFNTRSDFYIDKDKVVFYPEAPYTEVPPFDYPKKGESKTIFLNSVEDILTQLNWRKKGGSEEITNADREFVKAYVNSLGMDFERYTYLYHYTTPSTFPKGPNDVGAYMRYGVIGKVVESATELEQLDVDFHYYVHGEIRPGIGYTADFGVGRMFSQLALKKTTRTKANFIYKRSYTGIPLFLERKMDQGGLKYTYF